MIKIIIIYRASFRTNSDITHAIWLTKNDIVFKIYITYDINDNTLLQNYAFNNLFLYLLPNEGSSLLDKIYNILKSYNKLLLLLNCDYNNNLRKLYIQDLENYINEKLR